MMLIMMMTMMKSMMTDDVVSLVMMKNLLCLSMYGLPHVVVANLTKDDLTRIVI